MFLPGKSHGWRSLVGCRAWGREESDMTEQLPFQFSLSCTGEGNGNPLQCPCLENPRDRGAWWAAVYGVAQSWTRLKRLSSSRSSSRVYMSLLLSQFVHPLLRMLCPQLCLFLLLLFKCPNYTTDKVMIEYKLFIGVIIMYHHPWLTVIH